MKTEKNRQIPPYALIFSGVFLTLLVFSLALMLVILLFSESGDVTAAARGGLVLALLSAVAYAIAEVTVYPRTDRKALFSLSYFLAFALLSAVAFRLIAVSDLSYSFNVDGEVARDLLTASCFHLCATHAAALLIRLGAEIVRYCKSLFQG
ncbi:MAG: hypothetical protein E7630_05100 [Ruminococcaceae bacterium]|nr:hypothetical protein [Oscillospiraceae bacterium]